MGTTGGTYSARIFRPVMYTSFVGLITFHFTHLFTEAQSVLILAPNRDNDNY